MKTKIKVIQAEITITLSAEEASDLCRLANHAKDVGGDVGTIKGMLLKQMRNLGVWGEREEN